MQWFVFSANDRLMAQRLKTSYSSSQHEPSNANGACMKLYSYKKRIHFQLSFQKGNSSGAFS